MKKIKFSDFLGYVGALFMIAFSFTLNTNFAIFGLTLLTFQCYNLEAWNMVAINLVSIAGFIFNKM